MAYAIKGGIIMKNLRIALPTSDMVTVEAHFGHCKQFAIHSVKDNKVVEVEFVDAPPHQPGLLPAFLGAKDIQTIITGGMGQRAIDLFKEQNIEVILGANGTIKEMLEVYLSGQLVSNGEPCAHNDDHSCNE